MLAAHGSDQTRPGYRLARAVTEILAPAPVAGGLLVLVAWHSAANPLDALRWAVLAVLFAVVGVRRRQLSDRHVRMRRERPLPLMIGVASVVVGVVLLIQAGAPRDLIALEAAMAVGLGSSLLVTLAWKISIHVAVVAGAIVILLLVLGPAAIALVPAIALVAWARVVLRDHTVGQTVAGGILGAAVAAIVFSMLRG
jgi:membrane-associated phospholipid phosphatase